MPDTPTADRAQNVRDGSGSPETAAPQSRTRAYFAAAGRALRPGAFLFLGWVVAFEGLRLLLVVMTWSQHGDATSGLLFQGMLRGARFDAAIGAWLTLPFALWAIWRGSAGRIERGIFLAAFALIAIAGIFALIAEIEFYKEFQMRLGPLAYEYFSTNKDNNTTVLSMVWRGYPVVRWTLVCLALWAFFVWVAKRQFRPRSIQTNIAARLLATVLLGLVTLVAVRGGVQSDPLRWGDAYFSQNTYVNQMTENGLFSLVNALRHSSGNKLAKKWTRQMPADEAIQHLRGITLLPGEKLVAPEKYPLLRTSPPNDIAVKRPRNVVLVLMESFSARMCGATGAPFKTTPNYDALAGEGILFDRGFSCGSHTAQGVFATLCSFPSLPDYDGVMKESLGQQNFRTLPAIFAENGYENLFLYNGLFSWDNKEGFFRHQGVQRFIGRNDYRNPTFVDPAWGVCDLDVFNRAIEEFSDIADKKKPFFGIVLTLSNHSPFNLPKVDGLEHIEGGGDQNQRLNGIHYADWALGQFMEKARKQSWFNDTLFVFSGDHGFSVPPGLTDITLLRMHVPILFYGPEIFGRRHEVRHQTVGHLDLLPTILGTVGLESPHQSFGRDVFRLPPEDPGHAYVKRTGDPMVGWISGNQLLVGRAGNPSTLHRLDLGFPPSASEDLTATDPATASKFGKDANAFVVTGLNTLQNRIAAPREGLELRLQTAPVSPKKYTLKSTN